MRSIDDRINRRESFIVANDGQFLGKLCLNRFDSESILNQFGNYGNRFSSLSIFNQFSVYGSRFSALSPFNEFTQTPPKIYLRGALWGFLTVNAWIYSRKLNPLKINQWMSDNGLYY
jgi:hypothetical protein